MQVGFPSAMATPAPVPSCKFKTMHEDAAGWPFSKELMIFIVTCQLGDLLVRCVGTWPAAAKRIGRLHAAARRALTILKVL